MTVIEQATPNPAFRDFMTEQGAQELKRRIEHFWTARKSAVAVRVALEDTPRNSAATCIYVVRSNLIRGLPP